jgi:hypothetical protein
MALLLGTTLLYDGRALEAEAALYPGNLEVLMTPLPVARLEVLPVMEPLPYVGKLLS